MNPAACTVYAPRTFNLLDHLSQHFRETVIDGEDPCHVRFVAPAVETTGGGKQARQSIHLVPAQRHDPPWVCGFIDIGVGLAHVRSYASLQSVYQARLGARVPIDETSYVAFVQELTARLTEHKITTRLVTELAPPRVETPTVPTPRAEVDAILNTAFVLAVGTAAGLALGAALWHPESPLARHPVPTLVDVAPPVR